MIQILILVDRVSFTPYSIYGVFKLEQDKQRSLTIKNKVSRNSGKLVEGDLSVDDNKLEFSGKEIQVVPFDIDYEDGNRFQNKKTSN